MRQRIEAHILHSIVALNGRNTARETPQTQIIKPQHTFTLSVNPPNSEKPCKNHHYIHPRRPLPASESPIYSHHHTDSHAPQRSAAPTHPQINSEDTDNHHTDNLFSHRFHRSTRNYTVRLTPAIMNQP